MWWALAAREKDWIVVGDRVGGYLSGRNGLSSVGSGWLRKLRMVGVSREVLRFVWDILLA